MTNFTTWTQENLAKFSQEANDKIIELNERIEQRPWVELTDDEVSKLIDNEIGFNSCCGWEEEYTRAVEAKLKEKNT